MEYIDFKILEKKILTKLNTPIIPSDDEIVNLYDLNQTLRQMLSKYNKAIYKYSNKLEESLNTELLKTNDSKRIQEIIPGVKNGISYVSMIVREYNKNTSNKIMYLENNLNSKKAKKLFKVLNQFIEENQGIDFMWDKSNEKDNVVECSDGFLNYKLDLRNVDNPLIGFENKNNSLLACLRVPYDGGELIDYIEFYKESYLKRQAVPMNSLPTRFKTIYLSTKENNITLKK